jgi:hypothetical protein
MIKKLVTYIEREPWEETMRRQQRWLDRASILVLILAAIYFSPALWHIFTR